MHPLMFKRISPGGSECSNCTFRLGVRVVEPLPLLFPCPVVLCLMWQYRLHAGIRFQKLLALCNFALFISGNLQFRSQLIYWNCVILVTDSWRVCLTKKSSFCNTWTMSPYFSPPLRHLVFLSWWWPLNSWYHAQSKQDAVTTILGTVQRYLFLFLLARLMACSIGK
jgi:hypothetical protein